MIGATQWYQVSKKTLFNVQHKEKNLEVARVLSQFLRIDLKNSGYKGCRSVDDHFALHYHFVGYGNPHYFWQKDKNVFGFVSTPGVCVAKMPNSVCARIKENSEILVIYNIVNHIAFLKQAMANTDSTIEVIHKNGIRKKSMVLIGDCLQADIFIANEVAHEKIFHEKTPSTNTSSHLSKSYGVEAELAELQTVAYYLGTPARSKTTNSISYSLYRDDLFHEAEEITDGIIDFKIEYGLLMPNEAVQYRPVYAIQDTEWPLVQSLRLKVKLSDNQNWSYEFAIGNRRRSYNSAHFINSHFFGVHSCFVSRYVVG
jgi:hypothetical protein